MDAHQLLLRSLDLGIASSYAHDVLARDGPEALRRIVEAAEAARPIFQQTVTVGPREAVSVVPREESRTDGGVH